LARLAGKLGAIDDRTRAEIAQAMHRVMDKLLHAPTVRVKELAGSPGGDSYETALRVLFDLDPEAVEAVTRADTGLVAGGPPPAPPPAQEGRGGTLRQLPPRSRCSRRAERRTVLVGAPSARRRPRRRCGVPAARLCWPGGHPPEPPVGLPKPAMCLLARLRHDVPRGRQ